MKKAKEVLPFIFLMLLLGGVVAHALLGFGDDWFKPATETIRPIFESVGGTAGVVTKNEETNLLGFYWVTFQRDDDEVPVTGLSRTPLPIGTRAYLTETTTQVTPDGPPQTISVVLPTHDR